MYGNTNRIVATVVAALLAKMQALTFYVHCSLLIRISGFQFNVMLKSLLLFLLLLLRVKLPENTFSFKWKHFLRSQAIVRFELKSSNSIQTVAARDQDSLISFVT